MKNNVSKPNQRRSAMIRARKRRRKKAFQRVVLVLLLVLMAAGAGVLFYLMKGGSLSAPAVAYNVIDDFQYQNTAKTKQRAKKPRCKSTAAIFRTAAKEKHKVFSLRSPQNTR